ncbi:MAG: sensor histidine kinase [Thermodesulfobacteriota bacterium]
MSACFDYLKKVYFFNALTDADIRQIEQVCREEVYAAEEVIFHEGDEGNRFFIILDGHVEIWKDYPSVEQDLLAVYGPLSLFGELALIDHSPRSATVVAGGPVRLLSIRREDFDQIIAGSAPISLSIMKAITATVRRRTNEYVNNLRAGNRCLKQAYEQLKIEVQEREDLEERLRQAEKLEAMATLAGGVAHDFNNLLMCIQGNISLIQLQIDPDHPVSKKLRDIEGYIQCGGALTKRILGFARTGPYSVVTLGINDLMGRSLRRLRLRSDRIRISERFDENGWSVAVNPEEMEQALVNLYCNACEAMPDGGTLRLGTHNRLIDGKQAKLLRVRPGRYVEIAIADTGGGMCEMTRHRIFDPFFTTKEMGKGAGLGLASTYSVVKNHSGAIYVDSEQGKGTTFTVYLPADSGSK